ncbi:hypothetical protein OG21DRAFT_860256 [Imleria badia]|nr:hypothetical protein OG21DRAFT_860256 [Imleria badia]
MIRLHHCEALHAAGRTSEAAESLPSIINNVDEEIYRHEHITTSVTNLLQRCLSTPESSGNVTSQSPREDNVALLLQQWVKLKLERRSWIDALDSTIDFMASRFTIYQTICIQLDTLNKITDATECFHAMTRVLGGETNLPAQQAKWVSGQ